MLTALYIDEERKICDEIRAWSAYALEVPNPYFAGLPACPFARTAWQNDRVATVFKYGGNQALYSVLAGFDDSFDLVIVVNHHERQEPDAYHDYLDQLNVAISERIFGQSDLWVMGFHPDDGQNELIDDSTFEPLTDTRYSMIFVQRLSKIQEAADKLKELGYYDQYLEEYDAAELFEKRAAFYRRLKDGNEPS